MFGEITRGQRGGEGWRVEAVPAGREEQSRAGARSPERTSGVESKTRAAGREGRGERGGRAAPSEIYREFAFTTMPRP